MTKTKVLKKVVLGSFSLLLAVGLAGCGSANQASSSKSDSSSVTSSSTTAASAYKAANKLIDEGKYDAALAKLKDAPQTSKIKGLIKNLKTYMAAKDSYSSQDYDSAQSSINTLKSNANSSSSELQQKVSGLENKVQAAQDTQSTNSSNAASQGTTNSAASSSSASSATDTNSIIASFAQAAGYYGQSGYSFNITGQSGSTYTIEVRQDNSAGDVANLVGIYSYDSSTGSVSQTY